MTNATFKNGSWFTSIRMMSAVHLTSFLVAPRAYAAALWWYVIGKRVRARARFAAVLAKSPLAYQLWMQRREPSGILGRTGTVLNRPRIVAIVDLPLTGRKGSTALAATLKSLDREQIPHIVMLPTQTIADLLASPLFSDQASDEFWVMPLLAGDQIAAGAVAAYSEAISASDACLVYADDDIMAISGRRSDPHFKPNWNSELFAYHDFVTYAGMVRTDARRIAEVAGTSRGGDLVRLLMEGCKAAPVHVSAVLHHRLRREPIFEPIAKLAHDSAMPSVSVLIPTKNRCDLLKVCLAGLAATRHPDLEIIIIDNGSDDPQTLAYLETLIGQGVIVLRCPGPFNYSRLNNTAARLAKGEILCLLNNDIEMLHDDWLAILATQAIRPEVGAVGPQLLYPDGRIQHAGVVTGIGNAAGHAHRLVQPDEPGYFRRHALPQFVSAVTGACLVVRADRFAAVNGLNEEEFAVAFNDVDLCLRLNAMGWQSLYEPRARLVHHESVSRGLDRDPVGAARFDRELIALKRIWRTDALVDPYHHAELSRATEQFALRL